MGVRTSRGISVNKASNGFMMHDVMLSVIESLHVSFRILSAELWSTVIILHILHIFPHSFDFEKVSRVTILFVDLASDKML